MCRGWRRVRWCVVLALAVLAWLVLLLLAALMRVLVLLPRVGDGCRCGCSWLVCTVVGVLVRANYGGCRRVLGVVVAGACVCVWRRRCCACGRARVARVVVAVCGAVPLLATELVWPLAW